jgi:ribosome-associated protein
MIDPDAASPAMLTLRGEYITLAQALKAVGLAGTGGHAKILVRNGEATVNGVMVTQPGRKLHAGDRFGYAGGGEWTIIR